MSTKQPSLYAPQSSQHANHKHMLTPPPESYWDSIPRPFLTSHALKELDRRNLRVEFRNRKKPGVNDQNIELTADIDQEDLRHFARHGGADLRDIRGYHNPNMTETTTTPQDESSIAQKKSKNTSAYDENFVIILRQTIGFPDPQYYPDRSLPEPSNFDELKAICLQPRTPSVSVTAEEIAEFIELCDYAEDEARVMKDILPFLTGLDKQYLSKEKMLCTNYAPLTDKEGLVNLQPDFCDGVRPTAISTSVVEEIGKFIVPSKNNCYPALLNFFLEAKGPNGSLKVLKRQAFYNGCMGARGMHCLRSYGQDPAQMYDDKAYTITTTYGFGILTIYCAWPTAQIDLARRGNTSYHMAQLGRWYLADTEGTDLFARGITAFRNIREWAKQQREKFLQRANQSSQGTCDVPPWKTQKGGPRLHTIDEDDHDETPSDSTEDEEQNGRSKLQEQSSRTGITTDSSNTAINPTPHSTKRPFASPPSSQETEQDELALSPPSKPQEKHPKLS